MEKHNILSKQEYLFSDELTEALLNKKLPNTTDKKNSGKTDYISFGFARILNKQDKKIVYNYANYNVIFMIPLRFFLRSR